MTKNGRVLDLIRLRGGLGILLLWAAATIVLGIVNTSFDSIITPFLVLPALILALLGSPIACSLAIGFFALDILNSAFTTPFNIEAVALHVGLLMVAVQALSAVRRTRAAAAAVQPEVSDAASLQPVVPGAAADGSKPAGIGRRINIGLVVAALLAAFLFVAFMSIYIGNNGNVPVPILAAALAGAGVFYTLAVILVSRVGIRHAILIWLAPGLMLVLGMGLLVVACPACTWASR